MLSNVIRREKIFSLLHKIDVDLAEFARARGCPFVGGRCTMRRMSVSHVAVPRIYPMNF